MAGTDRRDALNTLIEEIFQSNGKLLSEGDRLSAEFGLTGARWQVLAALQLEQQALSVAQIARRMGLQRQSVQRLTDILVGQGLLAYQPNPEHKRAKLVNFTATGHEVFEKMQEQQFAWADALVPEFSLQELQQAATLLRKLRTLIDLST